MLVLHRNDNTHIDLTNRVTGERIRVTMLDQSRGKIGISASMDWKITRPDGAAYPTQREEESRDQD